MTFKIIGWYVMSVSVVDKVKKKIANKALSLCGMSGVIDDLTDRGPDINRLVDSFLDDALESVLEISPFDFARVTAPLVKKGSSGYYLPPGYVRLIGLSACDQCEGGLDGAPVNYDVQFTIQDGTLFVDEVCCCVCGCSRATLVYTTINFPDGDPPSAFMEAASFFLATRLYPRLGNNDNHLNYLRSEYDRMERKVRELQTANHQRITVASNECRLPSWCMGRGRVF